MAKIGRAFRRHFSLYSDALLHGDILTRLSFLVMGAGSLVRGQILKGIIFLGIEAGFIYYMLTFGFDAVVGFFTLGTVEQGWIFDERKGIEIMQVGDNSMLMLLYGIISLVFILVFIIIWRLNIKSAYHLQKLLEQEKPVPKLVDGIDRLLNADLHITLLSLPVIGILMFTVLPLLYMILVAFTNYDGSHQPPGKLFHWVGFENFFTLLRANSPIGASFWPILGWTLIWAVVATVTCFVAGIVLAMWINSSLVKGKTVWRTFFIMSVAVPQFVSLLVMRTMLQPEGALNVLLRNLGLIEKSLPFLTDATWARVMVIIINLWLGAPYTMLISTGVLMNIPKDLYEAAQLDGAGGIMIFRKITMPYILFVMGPYLITQFIGNVNNFNVIFLLTQGGPTTLDYYQAGKTDLLVTWLYKLTTSSKDYSYASVIGILVFVISVIVSLLTYRRTASYKNEEGFQ